MPLSMEVKNFSIRAGFYRPARWLSRRLRPAQLRALNDDIRFYRSLLPPSALCFDVGANIGEMSEAMLKAGGRVVAFEPSLVALLELRARCSRERDWTLVLKELNQPILLISFEFHLNEKNVTEAVLCLKRLSVLIVTSTLPQPNLPSFISKNRS